MTREAEDQFEANLSAWIAVLDELSFYELLSLPEQATPEQIKAAFHRFAEAFHPDRHRQREPEVRAAVTLIFRKGAEAYRVLNQAHLRSSYNLDLARLRSRLSGAPISERTQSLEDLCATPGGRLHGRQAERALTEGNLAKAVELIDRALVAEGPSPALLARKQAVSDAIELASVPPEEDVVIPDLGELPLDMQQLLAEAQLGPRPRPSARSAPLNPSQHPPPSGPASTLPGARPSPTQVASAQPAADLAHASELPPKDRRSTPKARD